MLKINNGKKKSNEMAINPDIIIICKKYKIDALFFVKLVLLMMIGFIPKNSKTSINLFDYK